MPHVFSHAEYADMVYVYGFCNGNATASVAEYQRRFPQRRVPNHKVFSRIFINLRETGCFPSARISSDRGLQHEDDAEKILQAVECSPTTSSRRISMQLNIPKTRVLRTLHLHGLYPFHIQKVQHLQPGDNAARLQFCEWIKTHRCIVSRILFTDEATFTRDGVNNTRNFHQWSDENPHATTDNKFQRRFSVNVWCGIVDDELIGPFILENRLVAETYMEFLRNELFTSLENTPLLTRMNMYFQHDGAPPHTAHRVREFLNEHFAGKLIGAGGVINWPPRSPDLTPLDYCIWGWMKSEVYKVKVNTRDELITRIFDAAALIKEKKDVLATATQNIRKRVKKCIDCNGGIFEPYL